MRNIQKILENKKKQPMKLLGVRLDLERLAKLNNVKKKYNITLKKLVTEIIDDFLRRNKIK